MRLLVLQHTKVDDPGRFGPLLDARGIAWDCIQVQTGTAVPPLSSYDALWVLGGPMNVWEQSEYPWLVSEKEAIREAVRERNMPYLGICLGHQLLTDALGGTVGLMAQPEIGILEVGLNGAAESDALLRDLPYRFNCLQWHGAEVTRLPPGAVALAHSRQSAVQALRWGAHAWGVQFHCEVAADTVPSWCSDPDYKAALEGELGANAGEVLAQEVERWLPALTSWSDTLFERFVSQVEALPRGK